MDLRALYEDRLEGIDISSTKALEDLFIEDDRLLLMALMKFYLNKVDLTSYDILWSAPFRYAIYALCSSPTCKEEIKEYYKQYIDINEASDQVASFMLEINQFGIKCD